MNRSERRALNTLRTVRKLCYSQSKSQPLIETKWKDSISFDTTLHHFDDYWRQGRIHEIPKS
jgi:hypothetical protein